jgi:hypothetical protein
VVVSIAIGGWLVMDTLRAGRDRRVGPLGGS